jgi:hypothetical protein
MKSAKAAAEGTVFEGHIKKVVGLIDVSSVDRFHATYIII